MSTPFHIEVDKVKHFHGYDGVLPTDTPCDHDCRHRGQSVIAWGPDVAHYELVACDGGDACGCVTWVDGREQQSRDRGEPGAGFWIGRREWRKPTRPVRDQDDGS